MTDKTKLKSVEPLMREILMGILNLRTDWARLKKECPEAISPSYYFDCDVWACDGKSYPVDKILACMEEDICCALKFIKLQKAFIESLRVELPPPPPFKDDK